MNTILIYLFCRLQTRDSLANTLNGDILETIRRLDKISENIPNNADHLSSSSSGVSSDISSEESNTPLSTMEREREGKVKQTPSIPKGKVNMNNPPPKPQRQFLNTSRDNLIVYKSDGEALYATNKTYEEVENTNGQLRWTKENLV